MTTQEFDIAGMQLEGVHGIEASAGTGKTFAIALLYLRYLAEFEVKVDQILVVTFTEAATAELRDRIRSRLKHALDYLSSDSVEIDPPLQKVLFSLGCDDPLRAQALTLKLRQALADFHRAAIYTIHGFCQRSLSEFVFETGSSADAELLTDQQPLLDEIFTDFVSIYWTDEQANLVEAFPLESCSGMIREVIQLAISQEQAVVIPKVSGHLWDLAEDQEHPDFEKYLKQIDYHWQKDRDSLWRSFHDALKEKRLNARKCSTTRLEGAFAFIDDLLSRRSLRCFDYELGGGISERSQIFLTQSQVSSMTNKNKQSIEHPVLGLIEALVDEAVRIGDPRQKLALAINREAVDYARISIQKKRDERAFITFSDMLQQLDHALNDPSKGPELVQVMQKKYQVAMVDEFQDTDPTQFRIFSRIFQTAQALDDPRAFIMIGDPKQSIYSFRGADLKSYAAAMAQVPVSKKYQMAKNWRSDRTLIEALNQVYQQIKQPFGKEEVPYVPVDHAHEKRMDGSSIELRLVRRSKIDQAAGSIPSKGRAVGHVLRKAAEDIAFMIQQGDCIYEDDGERPIAAQDIAVLCQRNSDLFEIQQYLVLLGVPAVLNSTMSIFDTQEVRYVRQWLKALLYPKDIPSVMAALQNPIAGMTASELNISDDLSQMTHWMQQFQLWNELLLKRGVVAAWQACSRFWQVGPRIASYVSGERCLTNLEQVIEILHGQSKQAQMKVEALLPWLEGMIYDDRQREQHDEQRQLRLETDDSAVTLCTIHRSKGLEYPVVFCPTLWWAKKSDPEKQRPGAILVSDHPLDLPKLDVGSVGFEDAWMTQFQEQELEKYRVLYVALTRARHKLILHLSAARDSQHAALCQLFQMKLTHKGEDQALYENLREALAPINQGKEYVGLMLCDAVESSGIGPGKPIQRSIKLLLPQMNRTYLSSLKQTSFSALKSRRKQLDVNASSRDIDQWAMVLNQVEEEHLFTSLDFLEQVVPMSQVPGGPRLGDLIHQVMEALLLRSPDSGIEQVKMIQEALNAQSQRLKIELNHPELVIDCIQQTFNAPVAGISRSFKYHQLHSSQIGVELAFLLPVSSKGEGVSAQAMAACFKKSDQVELQRYAQRVAQIDLQAFRGYLEGYIDLVFEHEGRWWVTDWKSNHLGQTYQQYNDAAMSEVMYTHDYLLQAYLYGVALHRFLRLRLKNYQIHIHLAGYVYAFMRGVHAESGGLTGFYTRSYDSTVINALSDWLDAEGEC